MDGPQHSQARRAVISEFSVKRVAILKPRIQQIVDEHIDAILASDQPVDLVPTLSLAVPSLVICELLGVPYADHAYFQSLSSRMAQRDITVTDASDLIDQIRLYLDRLVTAKESDPDDDLLGRQILNQRQQNGTVDHQALVQLAGLVLVAGHETTANMISLGVIGLLAHPEQLAKITSDPSLTPLAVEELLRYFTVVEAVARVATEDIEIGGVLVQAGEGLIAGGLIANRDGDIFDRPDELDIQRGARHHVAFGYGPHQCLGQNLARLELQIVFDTLFGRIPNLRLAVDVDDLPFKSDSLIYGTYSLPVTW